MPTTSVPGYKPSRYPPFAVTADVVLFTIEKDALQVLLVRRAEEPFQGSWALPGGFVKECEDLDAAAARELAEETGLDAAKHHLEQLAVYGEPARDPRMRVVTVAYWAVSAEHPQARPGGDATEAKQFDVASIESGGVPLAFDHRRILFDARERLSAKLEYTALGSRFLSKEFSIAQLRRVYEIVWSTTLDPGNFQRGFQASGAFKREPIPPRSERGRPASQWSLKNRCDLSTTALQRPIARRTANRPRPSQAISDHSN